MGGIEDAEDAAIDYDVGEKAAAKGLKLESHLLKFPKQMVKGTES